MDCAVVTIIAASYMVSHLYFRRIYVWHFTNNYNLMKRYNVVVRRNATDETTVQMSS